MTKKNGGKKKKSKNAKKNSGGNGKRARKKAKLERRWGLPEQDHDDKDVTNRYHLRGQQPTTERLHHAGQQERQIDIVKNKQKDHDDDDDDFAYDDDQEDNKRKRKGGRRRAGEDDDDDDDDESSSAGTTSSRRDEKNNNNDDDDEGDEIDDDVVVTRRRRRIDGGRGSGGNAFHSLLRTAVIHNQQQQQQQQEEHDDDRDDDDDSDDVMDDDEDEDGFSDSTKKKMKGTTTGTLTTTTITMDDDEDDGTSDDDDDDHHHIDEVEEELSRLRDGFSRKFDGEGKVKEIHNGQEIQDDGSKEGQVVDDDQNKHHLWGDPYDDRFCRRRPEDEQDSNDDDDENEGIGSLLLLGGIKNKITSSSSTSLKDNNKKEESYVRWMMPSFSSSMVIIAPDEVQIPEQLFQDGGLPCLIPTITTTTISTRNTNTDNDNGSTSNDKTIVKRNAALQDDNNNNDDDVETTIKIKTNNKTATIGETASTISLDNWTRQATACFVYGIRIGLQRAWIQRQQQRRRRTLLSIKQQQQQRRNNEINKSMFLLLRHQHPIQDVMLPLMLNYPDMMITTHEYDDNNNNINNDDNKNNNNKDQQQTLIRDATYDVITLHILNHIVTRRNRIHRHDIAIRRKEQEEEEEEQGGFDGPRKDKDQEEDVDSENDNEDEKHITTTSNNNANASSGDWMKDQGFTRSSVLVMLPTRSCCYKFVKTMRSMLALPSYNDNNNNNNNDNDNNDNDDPTLQRFHVEYGPPPPEEEIEDDDDNDKKDDKKDEEGFGGSIMGGRDDKMEKERWRREKVLQEKGQEWLELFGDDVNSDDDFKLGIAIHPKSKQQKQQRQQQQQQKQKRQHSAEQRVVADMKLFTDFYKSDIIIASPLGMKMIITKQQADGGDEDEDEDNDNNDASSTTNTNIPNADFLSSIEICWIGYCDVILMQNWDHIYDIMSLINQQPKQRHDHIDFSRVRPYLLHGKSYQYRQLIMTSKFMDPHIISTFQKYATSRSGKVRIKRRKIDAEYAAISNIHHRHNNNIIRAGSPHHPNLGLDLHKITTRRRRRKKIQQVFQRIHVSTIQNSKDERIRYFRDNVIPEIFGPDEHKRQKHILIYIPSYFDYISIRNIFLDIEKNRNVILSDVVFITEYSRISEISRGRSRFQQGLKSIMLYTGRAHYFLRHNVSRYAKRVLFYGLPQHANLYTEIITKLDTGLETRYKNKQQQEDENDDDDDILLGNQTTSECSCLVLFTKYDSHSLERIVGTKHCKRMIKQQQQQTHNHHNKNDRKINSRKSKIRRNQQSSSSTFIFST